MPIIFSMKTFVLNYDYTGADSWEEWVQSRKPNWKFVVLLFFIRCILLLQTYQICLICRHIYYAYEMPFWQNLCSFLSFTLIRIWPHTFCEKLWFHSFYMLIILLHSKLTVLSDCDSQFWRRCCGFNTCGDETLHRQSQPLFLGS